MKSKVMSVIRFFLILIILACIGILGKRLLDYRTNANNNKELASVVKEVEDMEQDDGNTSDMATDPWEQKHQHYIKVMDALAKKYNNDDIVGFMEIPDVGVAYPIMQGPDNDYYLHRGINKEYDIAGSIFIDMNNKPDFNDDNTVIYGHHLEINSMFTPLDQYRKQEFAENHTTIYLATRSELREYQIFSAYGIPADYAYRTLYFTNRDDVVPYFNQLRSNSEVTLPNHQFKSDDQIITLSTCQYDYADQRLAIHAVRVK
ncbi:MULTISPECIES: class B sortase [Anaerococcus]|jgi:sortase, srtB family|uniref:Sortase (Surface protein transpeptidase) n=1 Tax=Anaerococcus octavius TaxID=54007 RepID=A0A2I1MAR3_9FIRM|nr:MULTISPECIES: class B sortase [Anaerococcus]MBS6105561.1 class B sortase [Anaerococcus sp.]MDU0894100.1 class B sortase [Anaerococcus sp.]MDU2598363.1 class B sortase [Anaerococcus sp.]MDU3176569.1 class B sortase [Anaerococcus sp.]MDU5228929.1 class B sortase [Anaerococcus sp.]